ncbi:MAG TPA: transcriptional regulator [Actinophytocola sp.]|nr:transcriptional regulator [Actinophytocola sp.]
MTTASGTSTQVADLVARARHEIAEQDTGNRFVDLLEAGAVPAERLRVLAAELHLLVACDQRSQALLASRFPAAPAGELFRALAQGEAEALRLLADFAAAVGVDAADLPAYEPLPLARAYPAYLAQVAAFGSSSAMALALLANVDESGGTYARVAAALRSRYGLADDAVGHFVFFAETPRELLDQAAAVAAAGLAAGESAAEAVRTARIVAALETVFWDTLAEGI